MDYEKKEIITINMDLDNYLTAYQALLRILHIKNFYDPATNQLQIIREIERANLISDDIFGDKEEDWH